MIHHASSEFWRRYDALPMHARELADKNFTLLKADARHPSLHFKHLGGYRSVRVGYHYRALGTDVPDGVLGFWIGTHAEYGALVG